MQADNANLCKIVQIHNEVVMLKVVAIYLFILF